MARKMIEVENDNSLAFVYYNNTRYSEMLWDKKAIVIDETYGVYCYQYHSLYVHSKNRDKNTPDDVLKFTSIDIPNMQKEVKNEACSIVNEIPEWLYKDLTAEVKEILAYKDLEAAGQMNWIKEGA